jgi:raffinose/stachyose/melibiose transport system substrate-binding protein
VKTWKSGTAALLTLALGATLAGCTTGGSGEGTESLNFLITDNGPEWSAAFDAAAAGFEEETGISVEIEKFSSDDYDSTIDTRLAAGADGPDFFLVRPNRIPDYVAGGYLAPLGDQAWFTALEPGAQKAPNAVQDGEPYAFPIVKSGNHVVYNKALFEQAGITEVPLTLEELEAASQKLLDAGIVPFAMSGQDSWWLQFVLFHASAQHVLAEDPTNGQAIMSGEQTFAEDAGWKASLEVFQELAPYYLPDALGTSFDSAKAAFLDGSAAMFPAPWILPDVRTTEMDAGAFVFPTTDNADETSMWGDFPYLFGINPTPGNTEAAQQFAEYLFTDGVYESLVTGVAAFPVVAGVPAPDTDPIFAEALAAYGDRTFYGAPNDVWLPGVGDVLTTELQNLLAGQATVDEVLAKLDQAVADAQ